MNQDFSELVEYLDKKFTDVNGTFLVVNNRLSSIEETLEKKSDKEDVNNLLTAVDSYAKKADTYFQEMTMMAQKIDRHEKWFHQMAEKLGIKLQY